MAQINTDTHTVKPGAEKCLRWILISSLWICKIYLHLQLFLGDDITCASMCLKREAIREFKVGGPYCRIIFNIVTKQANFVLLKTFSNREYSKTKRQKPDSNWTAPFWSKRENLFWSFFSCTLFQHILYFLSYLYYLFINWLEGHMMETGS